MKPVTRTILAREGAGRKPYSAGLCREYATGCTCLAFSLQLRCRRRACRPAGIRIELTHLVEEGFVANAQHAGRILAAPMRLLQSVGDGFHLCFILQAAHQRLETLLARGRRFFAGRGSLTCGGHLQQLAEAAFIVLKNDVALDEIFQLPQVAGPGVAPSREYWWSCNTWSNLACRCGLISAISSRKIVPLLASSNFPGLLRTAPVKAPCS